MTLVEASLGVNEHNCRAAVVPPCAALVFVATCVVLVGYSSHLFSTLSFARVLFKYPACIWFVVTLYGAL